MKFIGHFSSFTIDFGKIQVYGLKLIQVNELFHLLSSLVFALQVICLPVRLLVAILSLPLFRRSSHMT